MKMKQAQMKIQKRPSDATEAIIRYCRLYGREIEDGMFRLILSKTPARLERSLCINNIPHTKSGNHIYITICRP